MAVKGFLRSIRENVWKTTREAHEDRALNSVMDGYSHEDMFAFVRNCFQRRKSHEQHLRTALDFLIGTASFYVVTTGASWNSQTSTLFTSPTKPISRARRGWPFFDSGKTNSTGKKQNRGHA
jgi:hypothetical protein